MSELAAIAQIVGSIALILVAVCLLYAGIVLTVAARKAILTFNSLVKRLSDSPYDLDDSETPPSGKVEIVDQWDEERPPSS